jgi:hypothetical protein
MNMERRWRGGNGERCGAVCLAGLPRSAAVAREGTRHIHARCVQHILQFSISGTLMDLDLDALEPYGYALAAIALPIYWFWNRKPRTSSSQSTKAPKPPLRTALTVLVAVHTLYIAHRLLHSSPPNVFQTYRIPISLNIDGVRAILLARAGEAVASAPRTEALLTHLASFDARTLYIRQVSLVL